jgi:glycosyltransferase involved in cell wall biosynthesis
VVIPAYNEADNLHQVLTTVCATAWLQEIIVVDDGSTDATFESATRFAECDPRLVVMRLPENQGKAAALLTGVRALHTDLVIFLDADLIGLRSLHLEQLRDLQISGSHEMGIAVFHEPTFINLISVRLAPNYSGQRCLWRLEAEEALTPLADARYGVEAGLNIHAEHQHWEVRRVAWYGVTHEIVWSKRRGLASLQNRWQMYYQIWQVKRNNRGRKSHLRKISEG